MNFLRPFVMAILGSLLLSIAACQSAPRPARVSQRASKSLCNNQPSPIRSAMAINFVSPYSASRISPVSSKSTVLAPSRCRWSARSKHWA